MWVADSANHRLQAYDLTTKQWTIVTNPLVDPSREDWRPVALAVDSQGRVLVADDTPALFRYDPKENTWLLLSPGLDRMAMEGETGVGVAVGKDGRVWWTATSFNHLRVSSIG